MAKQSKTIERLHATIALMRCRATPLAVAAAAMTLGLLVAATLYWPPEAHAQRGNRGRGPDYYYGYDRIPENLTRDIFPGNTFTFCRVEYTSDYYSSYRGRGNGWRTDYPASDQNFSQRLTELTTINVNRDENGQIEHAVVRLTDEELFNYPFIYMLEVGALSFSQEECEALRSYLLRGGFLLVDDFWGTPAWENWEYNFSRALPPEEYPIVEIPLSHPLFKIVFDIKEVPQVPSVGHYEYWAQTGVTYEGQYTTDDKPYCRGVFDKKGRLMAVFMFNTDLGDGWEREGEHEGYFRDFSVKRAYPMGINIVVYAMTH